MKSNKSKKLSRKISTISDFKENAPARTGYDTGNPTGTDPTNTTIITLTTVNTGFPLKK